MRAIFVSYRRHDAEGEAGRLFDDLVEQFDEKSVFMDVAAIEVGRDFRKAIDDSIASCGVLLAVIGPSWVDQKNDAGLRRLDDPTDFVRTEIASALRRDIPVVPVIVHGARMPRPDQLPEDIRDLSYRNAVELTHVRWKSDIKLLIRSLRGILGDSRGIVAARGIAESREFNAGDMEKYWGLTDSDSAANRSQLPGSMARAGTPSQDAAGSTSRVSLPVDRFAASSTESVSGDGPGKCNSALEPALIERITEELADYIGPIAEVVVKQAAKHCATVAELRRAVAEEIDASSERARFLDACGHS